MPSSSSNSSSSGDDLIFAEFQGNFIRKDGICYEFIETTTVPVDATPDGVEIFPDCLTCIYDDNSSSSSQSSQSSQSDASSLSSDSSQSDNSSSSSGGVLATCGTPNADPTINMTLSWIDADVTKSWLGCTWTNGETKEVYATSYTLDSDTAYVGSVQDVQESWNANTGSFILNRLGGNNSFIGAWNNQASMSIVSVAGGSNRDFVGTIAGGPFQSSIGIGILTASDAGSLSSYRLLTKQTINTYTDVNNITYTWTEGNGW